MGRPRGFDIKKYVYYDEQRKISICKKCHVQLKGQYSSNIKRHYERIHKILLCDKGEKSDNGKNNKIDEQLENTSSKSSLAVSDEETQSQQQFFIDEQIIPSTSQHEFTCPNIQKVQSLVIPDNGAEKTGGHNLNSKRRKNKHRHHNLPSSKKLYSVAYELLQNKQIGEKNLENSINLKSFGEYIDTELERLDKVTCAAVKMKIHKIIYEAMLKSYKEDDTEITNEILDDVSDADDNDKGIGNHDSMEQNSDLEIIQNSNAKEISKMSRKNKENEVPNSSILSERQTSQLASNAEERQTKRVKKKRLKSKYILSAVYDAIQTDTKQKTEQTVTFGAYIVNELKLMDNLTATNAKLKICQILFEASVGKLKENSSKEQANKNNTKYSNAEQAICNVENSQEIRLKEEVIDMNDDL